MGQHLDLVTDPLDRFCDLYAALNADRGWFGDPSSLRFAAMTAVSCPGSPDEVASAIRGMADEIKEHSGWFGELTSSLRFIVSAILVRLKLTLHFNSGWWEEGVRPRLWRTFSPPQAASDPRPSAASDPPAS